MSTSHRQNGSLPKKWRDPEPLSVPDAFQYNLGTSPLVSQILYRRGMQDPVIARGFLDESSYLPSEPLELPDLGKSVGLLLDAIHQKKRVGVWGDFDVDGQTATTLLVSIMREFNTPVFYHIPLRASEAHGINLPNLKLLLEQEIDLLITCDTGISAHEEIDYARQRGVQVIVTDHHDLPQELPNADAIVNPKLLPADHPQSSLPGVGVAYQLMQELCNQVGHPLLGQSCLDLVALGIVSDLAILKNDTRWLLQKGLKSLRNSSRVGLKILFDMNEINPDNITEEHISFYIAPRLNAVGRLSDANRIVEFLTTSDYGKARLLAVELEGLNAQRKLITDQVFQAAQAQLSSNPHLLEHGVIVLSNPSWPAGVLGIVASRLVEHYHMPTILFSTPQGQVARGSARSIEGINITEAIAAQSHILVNYGGHPMAAGLGIEPEKIHEFYLNLVQKIQQSAISPESTNTLCIDGYIPLSSLTLEFVTELEQLSPFGPGNPAPILASNHLYLTGYSSVGRNAEHLLLTVEDETGFSRKVIWWKGAGWPLPEGLFDLAYTVRSSTFRGQRDIQVEWIDFRPLKVKPIEIESTPEPIQIIDYRHHPQPLQLLEELLQQENTQVWGEGVTRQNILFLTRNKLSSPCSSLVIWTIPPGSEELRAVLTETTPAKIYLFGMNSGLDSPEPFLKYLAGLVKYAQKEDQGIVSLSALAAALGHRIRTTRAGMLWLQNHGHLHITDQNGDILTIQSGSGLKSDSARSTTQELKLLLDETKSYREYFLRADKDILINQ